MVFRGDKSSLIHLNSLNIHLVIREILMRYVEYMNRFIMVLCEVNFRGRYVVVGG